MKKHILSLTLWKFKEIEPHANLFPAQTYSNYSNGVKFYFICASLCNSIGLKLPTKHQIKLTN